MKRAQGLVRLCVVEERIPDGQSNHCTGIEALVEAAPKFGQQPCRAPSRVQQGLALLIGQTVFNSEACGGQLLRQVEQVDCV